MRYLMRVALVAILTASCSPAEESTATTSLPAPATTTTTLASTTTTLVVPFSVSSPAFEDGGAIPIDYTCDGEDVSPELNVVGLPETTRAIAVIVEDPDAPLGVWYHWVEFDIPATAGSLTFQRATGEMGVSGVNSWNLEGYMGPCPPQGEEHRYTFRIYAQGSTLGLPAGVDAGEVLDGLEANAIASVETFGLYSR